MASTARRPEPGEIEKALKGVEWPDEVPFTGEDFARLDTSDDALFYDTPKLVEHIDKPAQLAMQKFYASAFSSLSDALYPGRGTNLDVLDLCSSWVSHFPVSYESRSSRVAGVGMNEGELKLNPVLTEYVVQDLNKNPKLPYEDCSFDAVVCALSIDYLTKPLKVVKEMARVLRPGGLCAIIFSNRLFLTSGRAPALKLMTA